MKEVFIGNRRIAEDEPCYIVAEMSGNHGGSLDRALEIVHAAKRAGADAVKLQTYTADTITLKCDREDFLIPADSPWTDYSTLWELYDKAHTPWEWHETIFHEARSLDMEVFSSPFDKSAVELLEQLGASAYKIASPEITHIPLLERVASTGKPVIMSTGLADLVDIELALNTLRAAGACDIILLQCTTAYPAPPEEFNLLTITDTGPHLGVLTGVSDHTIGSAIPVASVVLGGRFIEKHFTLDDECKSVDSFFSVGEEEFARMIRDVRQVEKSLGKISYEIASCALPNLRGRRSVYVSASIKAGEMFSELNIRVVRPSFGLHPKHYKELLGRCAKRDLRLGDRLSWDAVE